MIEFARSLRNWAVISMLCCGANAFAQSPCPLSLNNNPITDPYSGKQCRGACGASCADVSCTAGSITTTVPDPAIPNCHWSCTYNEEFCGTAKGCSEHDGCYDECNNSLSPATCKRGCDLLCIANYGTSTCASWMFGGAPYDGSLTFSSLAVATKICMPPPTMTPTTTTNTTMTGPTMP